MPCVTYYLRSLGRNLTNRWSSRLGARVTDLSLDHDLGDDSRGTGNDVILWIEKEVVTRGFVPPRITVHSANPSARQKMEAGISSIERRHAHSVNR